MKIKLLLLAIVLTSQMINAQVPSYVPTNGLRCWWPFNGNANDESGNGNNGTVNGATLTTDRFGNLNNAYSFDGNGDNINLGVNPNISLLPNTNLSINLWFNNINNNGAFLSKYSNGSPNLSSFYIGSSPNNLIALGGNGTSNFPTCNRSSNWTNLTIVYIQGNTNLYLNGIFTCNVNFPINSTLSNLPLLVGSTNCPLNDPNCNFLNGEIDDIGIWNRALTQQEITNLYNSVSTNECLTMVINTGVLDTTPVSYTSSVSIYPNPANDQITIDCGNLTNVQGWSIKITNMLGQEVFNQPMNTQQYVVPLNTWSGQGMYFVKIINTQNEVMNIKKIILQ